MSKYLFCMLIIIHSFITRMAENRDPLVVTRRYMETWEPGAGGCSRAKQM